MLYVPPLCVFNKVVCEHDVFAQAQMVLLFFFLCQLSSVTTTDLIKAGATQSETSLFKQYDAGERVDLLDYDFPARTVTEKNRLGVRLRSGQKHHLSKSADRDAQLQRAEWTPRKFLKRKKVSL